MDSAAVEALCKNAVLNRGNVPSTHYVLSINENGSVYRKYREDGRIEYITI